MNNNIQAVIFLEFYDDFLMILFIFNGLTSDDIVFNTIEEAKKLGRFSNKANINSIFGG